MRNKRMTQLIALVAIPLAFGLAVSAADAAYSGDTTRAVCPGGALQPTAADRSYWTANGCWAQVSDPLNFSAYHYGVISIPVDRVTSSTTIFTRFYATGSGTSGQGRVCAGTNVYDTSGNWAGNTATACTTSSIPQNQSVAIGSLTLNPGYSVYIAVAAQDSSSINHASHSWTANGS